MKLKKYSFLFLLLLSTALAFAQSRPAGINLTSVVDYSTELVFTDAFKQAREWTVFNPAPGSAWDSGLSVPLLPNGFPREIPYSDGVNPAQAVRALMLWDIQGHYPSGKYRLIVSGKGQVRLWGAANARFSCPVDTLVTVNAANGGVVLEIERSLGTDPIKDVKFIYPQYVNSYQTQVFTTEFLHFIKDFSCIRFMDWLRTNNSAVKNWSERSPENYYTQAKSTGVAWEYLIQLCNLSNKDAWICVPHAANDQYIQELAKLLKAKLNPQLKIYLEYSNEVWNGIFTQNAYAAEAGQTLGYSGQPWERAWKYTAKRSADLFYLFEQEFGANSSRLVKVVPCWAANDWVSNQILTHFKDPLYNPRQVKADAMAIAPYFGGAVADQIGVNNEVSSINIPEIVRRVGASLPESYAWMNVQKTVADRYGLKLLAYEGGAHVVATWPHVDNNALTDKLITANRAAEFQQLYCDYAQYWYNTAQADLFCFFSSHGLPSKWGSWGMKEHMNQVEAPKYKALQACVFSKATNLEEPKAPIEVKISPNPSSDGTFTIEHQLPSPKLELYDALGRRVPARVLVLNNETLKVTVSGNGIFVGKMLGVDGTFSSFKVLMQGF